MLACETTPIQVLTECLFLPGDMLELRYLLRLEDDSSRPRGHSWSEAGKLVSRIEEFELVQRNRGRQDIYFGANPRKEFGGKKEEDVPLARSLFADFDGITVEEARQRLQAASMPVPTLLVASGHGFHAYWRLLTPTTDLARYRQLQQRLASLLGSDPKVCDPPRVMRLPGFVNHKSPVAMATLVDADPARRYPLEQIEALLPMLPEPEPKPRKRHKPMKKDPAPVPTDSGELDARVIAYLATKPPAIEGQGGHSQTMDAARAVVYGFDLGTEAGLQMLMKHYNPRCQPEWSEAELRHKCEEADSVPFDMPRGYLRDSQSSEYFNDLGNARRLIERHGEDLRYVAPWKKWIVWDGRRWKIDTDGEVIRRCIDVVDSVQSSKVKKKLGTYDRIESMQKLARSLPGVPVEVDRLDVCSDLLNCLNGTVDLRTGELRPHDRGDMLTKLCPVSYDPSAMCPRWDRFLSEVSGGNQRLIDYLTRASGYSLSGDVSEHALFFCYGKGCNGKSVFLNTLLTVLGPDFGMQGNPSSLMVRRGQHTTDLTDFHGKRFVSMSETEEGEQFSESLLKQLTGGDVIRARRMNQDNFEYRPTHKFWLAGNHKPPIKGHDEGVWRRLHLIPWTVTVSPDRVDKSLPQQLAGESAGILAWAVRGCLAWRREGLNKPIEVQDAVREYRYEQDDLSAFVDECCERGAGHSVGSDELRKEFTRWLGNPHASPERTTFAEMMAKRGFTKKRVKGVTLWTGLRVAKVATPTATGPSTPGTKQVIGANRTQHTGAKISRSPPRPKKQRAASA